jgi:mannosyl-oligosaccharide alpha-1,2-mannosidase
MNIPEIVNQIVDYVPEINWSVSSNNQPVSLFETTIRYMAGLLSGYDLLSGPLSGLVNDVSILQTLGDDNGLI